jgi:hypothetical protein
LEINPPAVVNAADGFAPPVWLARGSTIRLIKPVVLRFVPSSEFVRLESLPVERRAGAIDIDTQNA